MTDIAITFADGERLVFPCPPEGSVLAAAERAGHALAHNCRAGTCRTCVASLPHGGEVLLCQQPARPGFAAGVSYRRTELSAPTLRRAKINGFERLSRSVWRLRCRLQFPLPFLPGQYVEVSLPGIDGARCFSMANAPGETEQVFYIRDLPEGAVGRYLAERAKPQDPFTVRGPFGVFYLRATPGPKLFVAGGTGLAPIMSMLRTLDKTEHGAPLALVFGVTNAADAFALDELRELASRLRLELIVTAQEAPGEWPGSVGTAVAALDDVRPEFLSEAARTYLCGPPGMVAASRQAMARRGGDPARMFNEEFTHKAW